MVQPLDGKPKRAGQRAAQPAAGDRVEALQRHDARGWTILAPQLASVQFHVVASPEHAFCQRTVVGQGEQRRIDEGYPHQPTSRGVESARAEAGGLQV